MDASTDGFNGRNGPQKCGSKQPEKEGAHMVENDTRKGTVLNPFLYQINSPFVGFKWAI